MIVWLLHQKGFFDPLYDWWEYHVWDDIDNHRSGHRARHNIDFHHHHIHVNKHHESGARHHKHGAHHIRRSTHQEHNRLERGTDYSYYLHHVHKDKSKHRSGAKSIIKQQIYLDGTENDKIGHHKHRKGKKAQGSFRRPISVNRDSLST